MFDDRAYVCMWNFDPTEINIKTSREFTNTRI